MGEWPLDLCANVSLLAVGLDAATRGDLEQLLNAHLGTLIEAHSATGALDAFELHAPQLVVLDLSELGGDGIALYGELRKRRGADATRILVTAAPEDDALRRESTRAGVADAVTPVGSSRELVERVRQILAPQFATARLRDRIQTLALAQSVSEIGTWEWEPDLGAMHWSATAFRILGREPGTLRPHAEEFFRAVSSADRQRVGEQIRASLGTEGRFRVETRLHLPDGVSRFVLLQGARVPSPVGGAQRLVGTIRDITEDTLRREEIRQLADYDVLTGLPNRRLFQERLALAITNARARGHTLALLYLDLDRFKAVNDTLGHRSGDELLQHIADLLRRHVRETDIVARGAGEDEEIEEEAVSRLGGDEFTILLTRIEQPSDASEVARRLLAILPTPVSIQGYEVSTTGSIGIAIFPGDGHDGESLLQHADLALYHAKEQGRSQYALFTPALTAAATRRLTLERKLRNALGEGDLVLHYQPKFHAKTGVVTGMEALLRWTDPELGTISPREFIPVAEETGLIVSLGAWVIARACEQNQSWQRAGMTAVPVAVNVSSRQFLRESMMETVTRALQKSGLSPRFLEIEITESALLENDDEVARTLAEFQAMGIRIALDDFGTGYSALSYLTRFPLDVLKMDRCLVRDIDNDPGAAGIARAVIAMAHAVKLEVVAEGVDASEQAHLLREFGCDAIQGFLYGAAVAPTEFERRWLRPGSRAPRR
jgi:predicted signal transduction protein with EAL and GGDEF domain/DNA-binding response OmpR family regulator